MAEILHMVLIDSPVDHVYEAITEEKGLAAWWTVQAVANPAAGSTAEFKFGDRYHASMRILTLEPPKKVEWECVGGDEEWIGTRISFDLEKRGDQTLLRFRHGLWRKTTDFYASCNYNWGHYLSSLKSYCETGKGTPFEFKP
jgi:uncharacterized protein YndB with AHSA1/START domain